MFNLLGLLFGFVIIFGGMTNLALDCGKKSQRAKKRSVKSAKSAKKSAKRAAKKGKQSVKEGAEFAKEKTKETLESTKQSAKSKRSSRRSARSSRRSARQSSRRDAKPSDLVDRVAAKTKSAKESVKQKLEPNKKSQGESLKSQVAKKVESVSKKIMPENREPMDANQIQKEVRLEPRELFFDLDGGFQKVQVVNGGTQRQALKIKCSDNKLYRVNPVYSIVEPGSTLSVDVQRQKNSTATKLDQLDFLVAEARDQSSDPKSIFKLLGTENAAALVLPLKV